MFTTVLDSDDVPEGSLFGLESEDGQEIVLANVEGLIFCVYHKTLRSCGSTFIQRIIERNHTHLPHAFFAQFDVVGLKKIKNAVEGGPEMQKTPGLMDQLSESANRSLDER